MDCPECGAGWSYVSMEGPMVVKGYAGVWRARHCSRCGCSWETVELLKGAVEELQRAALAGEVERVKNGFLAHVERIVGGSE